MTDPIEEIAAEISKSTLCPEGTYDLSAGRANPPCECCQKHILERIESAARLRAWWSPERKAFHGAALVIGAKRLAMFPPPMHPTQYLNQDQKAFDLTYRALVESEKE
jgi:hypothetical protein